MHHLSSLACAFFALLLCLASPVLVLAAPPPEHEGGELALVPHETLATWPAGTFLESLVVDADGVIWIADHGNTQVLRRAPDGALSVTHKIPGHLAGLELATGGGLYATGDKDHVPTIYHLRPDGGVEVLVQIPDAAFLNGVTRLDERTLLVADSQAGAVWRVDTAARRAAVWLRHELLAHRDPADVFPKNTFFPGANGVKVFRDAVFVSVSDRALLLRIPLLADGSAGEPVVWAEKVIGDDFVLDREGNIYVPTHPRSTVVKVSPGGARSTLATGAEGVVGCTAVAFGRAPGDEASLYVVGNSHVPHEGAKGPARLVRLSVGTEGHPRHAARLRQIPRAPLFLVTAHTLPEGDDARARLGRAYLAYLESHYDRIALGAQVQPDPKSPPAKRLYLVHAADAAAARALIAASPYAAGRVYGDFQVEPFTPMLGLFLGGVSWPPTSDATPAR